MYRYHDGTKHHFHRFAQSLGYLDWASQPAPFRSFRGSRVIPLYPAPAAAHYRIQPPDPSYDDVFTRTIEPTPLCAASLGDLLRHAFALSAWKRTAHARWSLRVNPSSGNLHPTEAYVACGPLADLSDRSGLYHYAAEQHALEERCAFTTPWPSGSSDVLLVALTSIHWREAWKYGERAFRYCQHDIGHAIGAVTLAAAALGWDARLLSTWSQVDIAALTGSDRDADFVDAEREEPACVLAVGPAPASSADEPRAWLEAIRAGEWSGRASQLSEDHVQWTIIDEIAEATRTRTGRAGEPGREERCMPVPALQARPTPPARTLFLRRRSAVAFDGRTRVSREQLLGMLHRLLPTDAPPWRALRWEPRVHLVLFIHRVDDVTPGLYMFGRTTSGADRLFAAMGRQFSRDVVHPRSPLVRLSAGDCRSLARRLSCDQEIAADGCFSLAMVAEFDAALEREGAAVYRHLFWEAGVIGQVLYLEAEAVGIRGTGIGCFFDDGVHETLGLAGHAFQSLYHFTVGGPVQDPRVVAEPGYDWESSRV